MQTILVVAEDENVYRDILRSFPEDRHISRAMTLAQAMPQLPALRPDLIFVDLDILRSATNGNGYRPVLQQFRQLSPAPEIVVLSQQEMMRETMKVVKAGASDYLSYPIVPDEVKLIAENIYRAVMVQSELDYLRDQFWQSDSLELVRTKSPLMKKVFDKIRLAAPTQSTVLLAGETGTGKSLFARLIHRHSNRRNAQFISVHCGAIPDTLLESELFGHEKGAFTGAIRRKLGRFEIAKSGTILLDEIGTITQSAQIKLLQVMQERIFQRVGGEDVIEADARIIAATNSNLLQMSDDGLFRKDLYYRLNVFPIEIPPLREREEDIPLLAQGFLDKLNKFEAKNIEDIDPMVLEALKNYSWPGNIRELENVMERAYILETSSTLTPESFPPELFALEEYHARVKVDSSLTLAEVRRRGIEQIERCYLKELLLGNEGRIDKSATDAGISSRQLHKLMKEYGIRKEEFKKGKK